MAANVRRATAADVPLILQLIRDLAAFEREPDAVKATVDSLHATLFGPTPTAEAIVAEADGETVGMALFFTNFSTWSGRNGLYLEDLYVVPEARGRGIGKALLARVARTAVARGAARVEWAVLDWNRAAIEFYASIGATPMSEWSVHRLEGDALASLGA